jgi:hypothetical protein
MSGARLAVHPLFRPQASMRYLTVNPILGFGFRSASFYGHDLTLSSITLFITPF